MVYYAASLAQVVAQAKQENVTWQGTGPLVGYPVFGQWSTPRPAPKISATVVAFCPNVMTQLPRGRGKAYDGAMWRIQHTLCGAVEDLEWHEVDDGVRAAARRFRMSEVLQAWRKQAALTKYTGRMQRRASMYRASLGESLVDLTK